MVRFLVCSVLALSIFSAGASVWAQDGPSKNGATVLRHQAEAVGSYRPHTGLGVTAAPSAVIDEDGREQITATTEFPASAIAWLGLYNDLSEIDGSCTGTFIGPDALLTAGHCLYETATGYVSDVIVVPGDNGGVEPFGHDFAFDIWVPPEWESDEDELFDYGIISMPDSTLGDAVGWMSVAQLKTETLERGDFSPAIVGYPGDKPDETMWGDTVPTFDEVTSFLLTYGIDTFAGQSGSAIFSANTTEWFGGFVVGIHNSFNGINNQGTRVDDILLDDIEFACETILCTADTFFETDEPTDSPTPSATPTVSPGLAQFTWGDPDCNGEVSFVDALKDLKIDAGLMVNQTVPDCPDFGAQVTVDDLPRRWADVDCDDDIDPIDALKELKADAGLVVNQPVPGCPAFGQSVVLS